MKIDVKPGTRALLIRHGRTEWNEQGRLMGRADIPLDDVGRLQAQILPRLVRSFEPSLLRSSPLARARATASPLAAELDVTPQIDDRWSEVDVGELEGLTWTAIEERYPGFAGDLRTDPDGTRRPAGESDRELQRRAVAGLKDMMKSAPGECSVVVSHGGTIRSVLAWVLGVSPGERWRIKVANASISCVEMTRRGLAVRFTNMSSDLCDG